MADSLETCESCGGTGEPVAQVRRVYVTPEAWDTTGRVETAGVESWCFVCRTHYPHHELDGDGNRLEDSLSWPE